MESNSVEKEVSRDYTDFEKAKDPDISCPECGGLRGGHGNRRCSLMSLKYAQENIISTEQRWIKLLVQQGSHSDRDYIKQRERVTFWQGKFNIVKNENNALRNKLKRLLNSDKNPERSDATDEASSNTADK